MILFWNQWYLLKVAFFRKTMCCRFIQKYYITISLRELMKTLNQFFYHLGQTKIWKFACPFDSCNWMNQKQFWDTFIGKYFNKGTLSGKQKMELSLKTSVYEDIIFIWLSPVMQQLLKKRYFKLLHALCTWNKGATSCW